MIDIKIDKENMQVEVFANDLMVKSEAIDKAEFKGYMNELAKSDLMLEALRITARMMKPRSYEFKDVDHG